MGKSKSSVTILFLIAVLLLICLTFSGCAQQGMDTMTEQEARTLSERILQIWNEGDLALVDEMYTPECVRHDCGLPHAVLGVDALKNHFAFYRSAFPDLSMTIQETIVKGDKIVWHWTLTGTNTGPMGEAPPTGKAVQLSGVSFARIDNGKISELWDYYNQAMLLYQLGFAIIPPQKE
jgi:steroid delta-isomerase-like uncharacterized protein